LIRRLIALSLLLCWPHAAKAEALTLEAAVKLALRNNERGQKAALRVKLAEAQLERARDAFLPTLSAGASATWRPELRAGTNPSSNGTLTLTQPELFSAVLPAEAQPGVRKVG
jgi:outer membrane protein TolC